jgi:hypothetical protein
MDQSDITQPMAAQPISSNPMGQPMPRSSQVGSCPTCGTQPQASRAGSCPTCGTQPQPNVALGGGSFVYAIGAIEPRFPRPSVEKEFAQVMGRAETKGLTDRQALRKVLQERQNRYLVRQLCWIMTIGGLETYVVMPRDPMDFDLLVETLRPAHSSVDLDVIIGVRGGIATPDMCGGLSIPIVAFDALYSFERKSLVEAIPRPDKTPAKEFADAAEELFGRIIQMTNNSGISDQHRALNYLAVRYPAIYAQTAERFAANASLTAVDVRPSALSGTRKIVDVIFSYRHRATDVVEKYAVGVDIGEEFPYLAYKLTPYFDRMP